MLPSNIELNSGYTLLTRARDNAWMCVIFRIPTRPCRKEEQGHDPTDLRLFRRIVHEIFAEIVHTLWQEIVLTFWLEDEHFSTVERTSMRNLWEDRTMIHLNKTYLPRCG